MKNNTTLIAVIALIVGLVIGLGIGSARESDRNGTPNSAEGAPQGSLHNLPIPAGVGAARTKLAQDLKIDESRILIMSAYEKEWSDSCLGLGGPAESCLMAITPGFEVTMEAEGKTYVYRTNEDGTVVREQK